MLKYTETEIMAYCGGHLDDSRARQLAADLEHSKELQEAVSVMQASQLPIKEAFEQQALPAMPDSLLRSLDDALPAQQQHQSANKPAYWGLVGSLIAGVMLGVLLTKGVLDRPDTMPLSASLPNVTAENHDTFEQWVARVADYQSLYTQSTVANPLPDAMANAAVLLDKLSSEARLKTAIPDLSEYGYTFARAQELGFEKNPLVQLVYSKPGSMPLAFCYMRGTGSEEPQSATNLVQYHQLNTASWLVGGQQYVLVASESDETLSSMSLSARSYF